jgi:hypothetical protein
MMMRDPIYTLSPTHAGFFPCGEKRKRACRTDANIYDGAAAFIADALGPNADGVHIRPNDSLSSENSLLSEEMLATITG